MSLVYATVHAQFVTSDNFNIKDNEVWNSKEYINKSEMC